MYAALHPVSARHLPERRSTGYTLSVATPTTVPNASETRVRSNSSSNCHFFLPPLATCSLLKSPKFSSASFRNTVAFVIGNGQHVAQFVKSSPTRARQDPPRAAGGLNCAVAPSTILFKAATLDPIPRLILPTVSTQDW